jgi:dTDP-4-dehydrorhamnose reductase
MTVNILIFGKDGQLGKAFRALFDSVDDASSASVKIHYVGRLECDLTNLDSLNEILSAAKPDLIINAAAYTAVDRAETEAQIAFAINAYAPEAMAIYAAKQGATFLHYSTDYVFDGEKNGFYVEDDLRNPKSTYGKSKAKGEDLIENTFASSNNGQYAIFRTSWVYGEGGNFIRTILRLAKERKELKVISDQYGVPTNADWLAKASLDLVLDQHLKLKPFPSGIYHAVPQGETNWYELACLAVDTAFHAGVQLQLSSGDIQAIPAIEYPLPAPRPMNSRMSTDKLYKALELSGDMSKLQHLTKHWPEDVQAYVHHLVQTRDI